MSLLEEDLTRSTIGAFYDSYNKLGYGFYESIYVGGLRKELVRRGHKVELEVPIAVYYDGEVIGTFRADLVVDSQLLLEVEAEPDVTGLHERQLRNYSACTAFEVGLILCYGLEPRFKRMIHTRDLKRAFTNPWPLPSDPSHRCEQP
jgi:GxxExxY protein